MFHVYHFNITASIIAAVAVVGHIIPFRRHGNKKQLSLAIVSATLLFISLYTYTSELLSYMAFSGLIGAAVWLIFENRKCLNYAAITD